jgi:hypothetical protein
VRKKRSAFCRSVTQVRTLLVLIDDGRCRVGAKAVVAATTAAKTMADTNFMLYEAFLLTGIAAGWSVGATEASSRVVSATRSSNYASIFEPDADQPTDVFHLSFLESLPLDGQPNFNNRVTCMFKMQTTHSTLMCRAGDAATDLAYATGFGRGYAPSSGGIPRFKSPSSSPAQPSQLAHVTFCWQHNMPTTKNNSLQGTRITLPRMAR